MAEETQNLVQNEIPAEDVITMGDREPRNMSCNGGKVLPLLSIFVALLIAGQAVSIYFITQQQSKISELDATTKDLQLNEMIKKLPGSPPSQNRPKMRMATFNIPLAFSDDDGSQQNLEKKAMASNSIEDAAEYMLLFGNPLRKYPTFNGTILDNLRKLRRSLSYQEWMVFDSWMQQWYLFYLVQSSKGSKDAPNGNISEGTIIPQERDLLPVEFGTSGNLVYASTSYSTESVPRFIDETPSGAPLMTQCQMLSTQEKIMPGTFVPHCEDNGEFSPMQCWRSTGFCWCVYRNGTEIPETRTRGRLDCSVINEPDDTFMEIDY
ncbi:HLA class II histocompatibility antigen gamma chain isoform 1-T2 [Anomaloglossus baeobatrachus]|uniref:HLA class II histocompatibility antigen gamma chain isoform X1 n=1 Tax=Anomaloglossus baeobatrachus TaxID=238106 RepID=UPI003F50B2B4